ncbi:MAG TPA: hypothetical protein VJB15_03950 [Rhodothermia bacterium]|nr:hypothetical protein [Rhodothermia bacterium]
MSSTRPGQSGLFRGIAAAIVLITLSTLSACTTPQTPPQVYAGNPRDGFAGTPEANVAGFEDYVQTLGFGEIPGSEILEGPFPCKDPSKCGNETSVNLRIVPSNYVSNWHAALNSGNGHVVGKIVRTKGVPFASFNMTKADNVAYVWVGEMRNEARGAALYVIRGGTVKRILKFDQLRYCRVPNNGLPAVHSYRPSRCTETDSSPLTPTVTKASLEPFSGAISYMLRSLSALPPSSQLDGLWFDCTSGCCEAQYNPA